MEKKCQCRPSPRFLCPGNATQEENDSSSSRDIHILSCGIFFLVNLIHSVPGLQSSRQYSFGSALSISIPLRINKVIKIMFIKCAKRIQKGKSSKTMLNHCYWLALSFICWTKYNKLSNIMQRLSRPHTFWQEHVQHLFHLALLAS